jgi:hypothetical protein
VPGEKFFPMPIRFGQPSTADDWERLRREVSSLANAQLGYKVEWTETNTRRWGWQKFPTRVWFDNEGDYVAALCKGQEVAAFRVNLALAREQLPDLGAWLSSNSVRVVEYAHVWGDLLKVCRYFLTHPRPGLFARELPIEVDTKFIESHEGALRSLLDFLLPDSAKVESERFEERFGLRYGEPLIRFRLLDPKLKSRLNLCVEDMAVPLSQFRALNWHGMTALITENKMRTTFLSLPSTANAIGI